VQTRATLYIYLERSTSVYATIPASLAYVGSHSIPETRSLIK
jgi:hypothetical protein